MIINCIYTLFCVSFLRLLIYQPNKWASAHQNPPKSIDKNPHTKHNNILTSAISSLSDNQTTKCKDSRQWSVNPPKMYNNNTEDSEARAAQAEQWPPIAIAAQLRRTRITTSRIVQWVRLFIPLVVLHGVVDDDEIDLFLLFVRIYDWYNR